MTFKLTKKFLHEIVDSSVKDALEMARLADESENEQIKQAQIEDQIAATVGAGDESKGLGTEDDSAPTRAPESTAQAEPSAQKTETAVDADALIDKFNIIRSGHSMSDKNISSNLQKYLNGLNPEQQRALFGILKNISKIVAPAVDSDRMTKPEEEPSAVQAARVQMLQKRREDGEKAASNREQNKTDNLSASDTTAAPQRQSAPAPRVDEPEVDDVEDTSPPIRVGKRTAESIKAKTKNLFLD